MADITQTSPKKEIRPPVVSVGVIGWMKANLFNGWFNSILTVVTLFFLWKTAAAFFSMGFHRQRLEHYRTGVPRGRRRLLVDYFIKFPVYPVRFLSLRSYSGGPFWP